MSISDRILIKLDLVPYRSSRYGADVDRRLYDIWDRARRRTLGWRAGLKLWTWTQKPNDLYPGGAFCIASRHWPHLLCWSWDINWTPYRGDKWEGPRKLFKLTGSLKYRFFSLSVPWGTLHWHWQDFGDMVGMREDEKLVPIIRYPWGGIGGGKLGQTQAEVEYREAVRARD